MLDEWVKNKFLSNYRMAVDDGHIGQDNVSTIAWAWTEEEMIRQFHRTKDSMESRRQDGINKAFFGVGEQRIL